MGIPDTTYQAASNAAAALGTWITAFNGPAGTNGANESATSRAQTTWTPTGGNNVGSEVNVPVPAGIHTEGGIFSAATGGTFVGSGAFSGGSVEVSGSGASIDITVTWKGKP